MPFTETTKYTAWEKCILVEYKSGGVYQTLRFDASTPALHFGFERKVKRVVLEIPSEGLPVQKSCLNPFEIFKHDLLYCVINFSSVLSGAQFSFSAANSRKNDVGGQF
jgi:hypothetical protein